MIRYMLHFYLICQLFVSKHAEPIVSENAWPANRQDFTFVASLGLKHPNSFAKRSHFCGGSLITKCHVLTAAHCLESVSIREVDVMIGEVYLTASSPRYNVDGWITYDQWAVAQRKRIQLPTNDIAIVVVNNLLQTPANRPGIEPVVLTDSNNEQLHGRSAVIAGWGDTVTEIAPDSLLRARVTILTPEECLKKVKLITRKLFSMGENLLCSWATPYVLTGCGDSGGPLLDQNNNLLGVVNGNSLCMKDQWGNFSKEFLNQYKIILYASVDYYRDFIESYTVLTTRQRNCLVGELLKLYDVVRYSKCMDANSFA